MRVCGWEFGDALDRLYEACDTINKAEACEECPLGCKCIVTNTFYTLAKEVPFEMFEEMLSYAEDCSDMTERDPDNERALYEDRQRQIDIEERMIDAEWGL